MNLFPTRVYTIELIEDSSIALNQIRQNTKLVDSFVSEITDKAFIGQVQENTFKVISSAKGYGAFCIITGEFQGKEGLIKLKVHHVFKILSSILMLLPILGIILTLFQREVENPIGLLFPAILGIVFVRFVILELNFRIISKKALDRLTETIRISEITNVA